MKINGTIEASNKIILEKGYSAFRSPVELVVRDEKAMGTSAGTPSAINTWLDRTVNTVVRNEISGASLASNTITLPAGTYFIDCWMTMFVVLSAKARLYDTTGGSVLVMGMNSGSVSDDASFKGNSLTYLIGKFTLNQTSNLKIQMLVTQAYADGFGRATTLSTGDPNWGTNPVPTQIYLEASILKQ